MIEPLLLVPLELQLHQGLDEGRKGCSLKRVSQGDVDLDPLGDAVKDGYEGSGIG